MRTFHDYETDIGRLVERFRSASTLMDGILASLALGRVALVAALRQANRIAQALAEAVAGWVGVVIPRVYADSFSIAGGTLPPDEREAVQNAAEDLNEALFGAASRMAQDARKAMRELSLRQQMAQAERPFETPVKSLDGRGRRWDSAAYARMVLRTHLQDVANTASLRDAAKNGAPGVRVSDGHGEDTDEPCKRANGQAWSIPYAFAHRLEHPNCSRTFEALAPDFRGGLDRA